MIDSLEAFRSLNFLSVYNSLFLRKNKIYVQGIPQYIFVNFVLRNEMDMSVNLRSTATGCFVPPLPKKGCFKQSIRYSGCLGIVYLVMLKVHRQRKLTMLDV